MAYPGGKAGAGVYQTLINLMPPHSVYVEPFLGGGAVMRHKRPAALNIGLDLDEAVIESTPPSILAATAAAETGDTTRSRSTAATFAAARRSAPPETPPSGSAAAGNSVPSWRFEVGDAIAFLRAAELPPDALVYCDPPYLHSTRVCTRHYTHEMTDAQHDELLAVLNRLKCRVMISGYSSPFYAKRLKGWNATAFQAATRGKPAAEWVWYNFERPVELHDYRYLGESRRERESIRRKQRRWVARLRGMPMLERQALLSAIAEAGSSGGGSSFLQRR